MSKTITKAKKRPAEENPRRKVAKKKKATVPAAEIKIEDVTDDEKMGAIADASASAAIEKMKNAKMDAKREKVKEYAAKPGGNPVGPILLNEKTKPLPHQGFDSFAIGGVKPGTYEVFLIEYVINKHEKPSKHIWDTADIAGTRKQATTLRNRVEKGMIDDVARYNEEAWHREHMHDQKSAEQAVFKITAKTTDDEMLSWVERAQEIRKGLVDVPPVKKPKSFKPKPEDREFPKVRIRRVLVGVAFEDVPNS